MKTLLVVIASILLVGCHSDKSESEENSETSDFRYGETVTIKNGFYREYGCVVLREYTNSIFCKIILTPDKAEVRTEFQVKENFQKDNVIHEQ